MLTRVGAPEVREHYRWVETKLASWERDPSVAWRFAVMHHPPLIEPTLKKDLLPMLRRHGLDALFVGHKHWMEYATLEKLRALKFELHEYGNGTLYSCEDWAEYLRKPSSRKRSEKRSEGRFR